VATNLSGVDERTVANAYVYLLGRALVVRQERSDIAEPGVDYNVIKYNPIGAADFVNPNLDVAYLEAWIAVDDQTMVLLDVPEIADRYYTAQIMNEWGEVITNINERTYPLNPHGTFAFVSPDSNAEVPERATRVVLHSRKAKMLARIELKTDWNGAVALQQAFRLTSVGEPEIQPPAPIPAFDNRSLLGAELFDHVEALLAGALDTSPIASALQAKVRAVATSAADPTTRSALDELIHTKIVPEFLTFVVTKAGKFQNNWLAPLLLGNYGSDYWVRTGASLLGIWANTTEEVIYFVGTRDADGELLNGTNSYVLHFPAGTGPDTVVDGYWSVILVDVPNYRVVPNSLDRFNFNSYSPLERGSDGALRILIATEPSQDIPATNWLPSPAGDTFSLTIRLYLPKQVVANGDWFPPALKRTV